MLESALVIFIVFGIRNDLLQRHQQSILQLIKSSKNKKNKHFFYCVIIQHTIL